MFEQEIQRLLGVEGGYSDRAADRGGKTRFGITEATARRHGYAGAMADLPLETAKAIYRADYWDADRLDEIGVMSPPVAHEMFDTGVNCGIGTAAEFLQDALNDLNRDEADYRDIPVDGHIGPATLLALKAYLGRRGAMGVIVLLRCLNAAQIMRYRQICKRDKSQEKNLYGWVLQRGE
jgi:lysozyme family protein